MGLFRGVESLRNDVTDGSEAMALRVLESCDATGCGPTETDVLAVLRAIVFPKNFSRAYLSRRGAESVQSFTLGLSPMATGGITADLRKRPCLARLLCQWYWAEGQDVPFSAIQVNGPDLHCVRHRDGNNSGPSCLKALGNFAGGNILLWTSDTGGCPVAFLRYQDARRVDPTQWVQFDGLQAHEVEATSGERFSLVYFCLAAVPEEPGAWAYAASLGFGVPD